MLAAALAVGACSTRPAATSATRIDFTQQLRSDSNFSNAQMRELQFYAHDAVVLERHLGGEPCSIVHGRPVVRTAHDVEQIEFPAGTPGVATQVTTTSIAFCFEGPCEATLMFEYTAPTNDSDFAGSDVTRMQNPNGNAGRVV